ncbi:bifunctional metallophosphatase/5'-nucleotidase [Altererythrobacter sp. ZODW24]|uniref:bifunctional metallophosphatase/5'-nucleotidase n=1 Tax=Altererythrobacter sp. ZODW24 TaxID=2185142 RepID=UPI000DF7D7F2|nr:bifunctional metallophosphatase/5'-nucleotidase [Altererythrobacter sp. ZODW24]
MIRKIIALPAVLAISACATIPPPQEPVDPVAVRIIGINDFHGNIEPPSRAFTVSSEGEDAVRAPAGGGAYLASAIGAKKAGARYSMVISAGDMIGGSPIASSLFLDEPAIGVMNRIGIDFNAVGNHEFDRGTAELQRIQNGGCEKNTLREPCQVEQYAGADFQFLAANVTGADGQTIFPSYGIKRFGSGASEVAVAVIGLTLEDTPTLVTPSGIAGLTFAEEASTINALIPQLEAEGADAIIVSIHQGLFTEVGYNDSSCGEVAGALLDVLAKLDPKVDLVISGHTHRAYICDYSTIDPARNFLVTSAASAGTVLTNIELVIDPVSSDVVSKSAYNILVQNEGTGEGDRAIAPLPELAIYKPDAEVAAYVALYTEAASEFADRSIGRLAKPPVQYSSRQDSPVGNLIADAQLAATRDAGAQIAFMNSGGVRADLVPAEDGTITFGEIYAVQPFSNTLITKTFTGAQVLRLLEKQVDGVSRSSLFVSDGFAYSLDMSRASGNRVAAATLNGEAIDPAANYRVTMNSFLASGGDGFTTFNEGTGTVVGPLDLDAMEAWIAAVPVRQLPAEGRATFLTPGS